VSACVGGDSTVPINNPIGFSLISGAQERIAYFHDRPFLFIHFFLFRAIIIAVLRLMISFQRKIVMRGALIIVMVVSLLIVGILVMKNMGVDKSTGVVETQTKQYTESAKSIADEANERTKALREQMNKAE
jgi:glucan phosphoethanolaminetransferase (alkaline phosphatase superfamily)